MSPHFFLHYSPQSLLQMINKISIGPDKPPPMLCFCFKQNFLFGHSPLLARTPLKCTCSFNRPWYPSFKGIRVSTDWLINNFFFWRSPHFSEFSPNAILTTLHPPNTLQNKSRRNMNSIVSNFLISWESPEAGFTDLKKQDFSLFALTYNLQVIKS